MKSLENRRFIILLDKLKDLFTEWCKSSTSHGIPNIARAENKIIAIVWCLAFTISTGFCGFYILQTIIEVSKNPTMINYEIIEETPAIFPTISICNLNPFKTTNSNVYNTLLNVLLENNFKYIIHPNLASIAASSLVKSYVFNLPDETKKTFSYQYSELVYSCKFNGYLCTSKDFEWFYSFDYGNCYKYNPNGTKMVGKSGSQGGLRLEIFVGNSSDSEAYTIKRGIRFLIHNHTDFKSISNYGQDASAGFSTEVKINRNIHSKLGAPFSNCLEDVTSATKSKSDLMILMFDLLNLTIYTREMCLNVCYQIPLEESCNCSDASIPQIQANLSRCVSSTQIKCQEEFFQNFYSVSNSYCQDQCPKECLTYSFSSKISQSEFFTNWYYDIFSKFATSQQTNTIYKSIHGSGSAENARKNVLLILFNYEDMSVTKITEQQFWSVFSILSNIGGNLGLFVGISILSLIEILELIIQIILTVFNFYKNPQVNVIRVEAFQHKN